MFVMGLSLLCVNYPTIQTRCGANIVAVRQWRMELTKKCHLSQNIFSFILKIEKFLLKLHWWWCADVYSQSNANGLLVNVIVRFKLLIKFGIIIKLKLLLGNVFIFYYNLIPTQSRSGVLIVMLTECQMRKTITSSLFDFWL